MDLKQYGRKIRDQLLNDVKAQANKQKLMETGQYERTPLPTAVGKSSTQLKNLDRDYDDLIRRFNKFKGAVIAMDSHPDAGYNENQGYVHEEVADKKPSPARKVVSKRVVKEPEHISDSDETSDGEEDESEFTGGKFNFIKSMKHAGKEIATGVKKVGLGLVTKEIASAGYNALKSGAKSLVSAAPEALAVGEEVAPLALAAAGMPPPKEKRTRQVSQKEINRHALIRKLIQQHNCTLAEASKHIKENNLQY
jgi:hypothetical protein